MACVDALQFYFSAQLKIELVFPRLLIPLHVRESYTAEMTDSIFVDNWVDSVMLRQKTIHFVSLWYQDLLFVGWRQLENIAYNYWRTKFN